jgi:hypothetical protein
MRLKNILAATAGASLLLTGAAQADDLQALADEINANLEAAGANYRAEYAEILTTADAGEAVAMRFFNDRGNKQLPADFVPGDTRRAWSSADGNTLTWTRDAQNTLDVTAADQSAAIANAMATWEDQKCSALGLTGGDIAAITGVLLGQSGPTADVMHNGFYPPNLFAATTLAVTVTFTFINPDNSQTDINNDGLPDTAFREIYYNDGFAWATNGGSIDIETVALHEAGHGLSQAHFGTAFMDSGTGKIHFAPRAVMNAAYSGVQHDIKGTDKGGHCSLWGDWPNN